MNMEEHEQALLKMEAELIALRSLALVSVDVVASTVPGLREGMLAGLDAASQAALSDESLKTFGGQATLITQAFERLRNAFLQMG